MNFYLQCGNGFKSLSNRLNRLMGKTTFILSPRDLSEKSQIDFAHKLRSEGHQVLFDPQVYAPQSDKPNFTTYRYWPDDGKTGDETCLSTLLKELCSLNEDLGTRAIILPTYKISHVGRDRNDKILRLIYKVIGERHYSKLPCYITLCLEQNVLLDECQVDRLLNVSETWDVEGVYLVAEHPDSDYFVDNPFWMFQLMRLCAGMRLQGKQVILGYANHQMLCMTCMGIEAIASGNWMNTRSFTFDKFKSDTGDIKRHKLWYYAPSLLTEYSIPYLDIAHRGKLLKLLDCRQVVADTPASVLFDSQQKPSAVGYNLSDSFVHYLLSLDAQVKKCEVNGKYVAKRDYQMEMLQTVKQSLSLLLKYRINGQNRDFFEILNVNETALTMFDKEFGMRMSFV